MAIDYSFLNYKIELLAAFVDGDMDLPVKERARLMEKRLKSSRRKFLIQRNFRPLTPPCVPFGTRRFNQLNK